MKRISNHAIERFAQRYLGMDEVQSTTLTVKQYDMIRNTLFEHAKSLPSNCVVNVSAFDMKFIIKNDVLVTLYNY